MRPPRPEQRVPPLLRGLPESRQLLRDSGQALRLTVCGATRIGLVFLGREASETAWCLSGGEAASGSAHAAYRSWPSSRRTARGYGRPASAGRREPHTGQWKPISVHGRADTPHSSSAVGERPCVTCCPTSATSPSPGA